jgi:hypothetical protein
MKSRISRAVAAAIILILVAGCGTSATTGATQSNGAANGANTAATANPAPANNGQSNPAPANNGQGRVGPGVSGQVTAINGNTLTVQDQRQQSAITVNLTDSTQVFKQATIDIAKVPVGETISAFGSQDGDVFTATQVRIGAAGSGLGGRGQGGPNGGQGGGQPPADGTAQPGGGPNGGQPPADGTAQPGRGFGGGGVFGTVESVSGDTITVKTANGETVKVRLAQDGRITQQVAGTRADITVGVQVSVIGDATGEQNGTTVTATQVNIVPLAQQQ